MRRRRLLSGATLTLFAVVLVALAVTASGTPSSDVTLNDGSVWVTNTSPRYQLLGRLNPQIQQLDLGIQALSGDFDVFQNGSTVFLDVRSGGNGLREIDVVAGKADDLIAVTPSTVAAFGDDTIALLDTDTGDAWVRTEQTIHGFTQNEARPDLKVGIGGAITVGTDGTAYVISSAHRTVTPVTVGVTGLPEVGKPLPLGGKMGTSLQATVVGDVPIVLDQHTGKLLRPGAKPVSVPTTDPESVQLQQPGPASAGLYVATRTELLHASEAIGVLRSVQHGFDGPPAAPVALDGYVHAAWADPAHPAYLRLHGAHRPLRVPIPSVTATAKLVFRTNRHVVVLNDVANGDSWLVQQDGLPRVNNWDDVDPSKHRKPNPDPNHQRRTKADRNDQNHPPKAIDDRLGARPGQDSILPVTRNDVDLDGDILTIPSSRDVKQVSGPTAQQVAIVGNGTELQVRFEPNDGGKTAVFTYGITDGRASGTDQATVTVPIVALSDDSAPELVRDGDSPRQTTMTVERGQRTSQYVLPDWTDEDGDSLVLQDASIAKGGSVTFRPDGVLTFADDGRTAGQKKVNIIVSDGREHGETKGQVIVNVSPRHDVPPTLIPDRAVGTAGSDILVSPLANDQSRDGTDLHLRDVTPVGGIEIVPDPTTGTFVARTSTPGTYYLDYSAYTEHASATSFVRLDVLPKAKTNLPPVAMKDQGLIPPGGFALVDLLANDYDPENGVLAVTSIQVPPGSGIKASLLENRLLRVESTRDLTAPVSIDYTVSDGQSNATGSVTVGQATHVPVNRPPVAVDDHVRVRAGAVANVPVLENDSDPDGDDLYLYQEDIVKPKNLPLFVSGRQLRFRAPNKPGEVNVTYGIRDIHGQRDDAQVSIEVIADDPTVNAAPRPQPVTARAVGTVPIHVDLDLQGSDPDGDAVSVKTLQSPPKLGRIVKTGLDWIEYEPFPGNIGGTDSFQVQVQDRYGSTALQQVHIAVVPRAAINQPPTALDDHLLVRPARTIQYDVLANDSDPDGDPIALSHSLQAPAAAHASASGRFVTVTVPPAKHGAAAQTSVQYGISDGIGGSDSARFTIDASPDAPLYAPITRDDSADLAKVAGKRAGSRIVVDVLANDGDLDGRKADLRLVAFDTAVSSVVRNKLSIVLKKTDQIVAYQVNDAEGNQSYGFVFVAGTDHVPPVIDPRSVPIHVKAGEQRTIALHDVVVVRRGRTPIITSGDTVASAPFAGGAKATSKEVIEFTAPKEYDGAAAVTFEVTDGTSLNDPTGLTSTLTIPIDVKAKINKPPVARDIRVQLAVDEPKTVDLAATATDPNPEDQDHLQFTAKSNGAVHASIESGHKLALEASKDANNGDTAAIPITVKDTHGATASAVAYVTVTKTDKPLVTVSNIGPIDDTAGTPVSININDYASNTFSGAPLSVDGAVVEAGQAHSASASGSTVSVTPDDKFSGTVSVKFTVHDGSDDPARDVTARMSVAVVAPPSAPGRPSVSSTTANSAMVTWTPSENNGAPITQYTVQYSGGSKSCGAATTCEITGLTPGQVYSFTATAENKAGTSDPSAASDEVTPDKVPDAMTRPAISQDYTQRDKQLIISWMPPANEGSAIKYFEIHELGTGETRQATSNPFTWSGLQNGTSVQFEIRAVNNIVDPDRMQQFSDPSDAETPFGTPDPVAQAAATASEDDGVAGGIVNLSWSAPADNGDTIDSYKVVMFKDGGQSTTLAKTDTSAKFNVDNGHDYTFTVTAHNRAGDSTSPSPKSAAVNPYDKASAVLNLIEVPNSEADKTAKISFAAPSDDGGRPIVGYKITSNGGGSKQVAAAGQQALQFSANSGPYSVTVAPLTKLTSGGTLEGKSAAVGGIHPFGPTNKPVGESAQAGPFKVYFAWSAPPSNGRPISGSPTTQYNKGGGWVAGTSADADTATGGGQGCVDIRTVADGAPPSATDHLCGNSQSRSVSVTYRPAGGKVGLCQAGTGAQCDYVVVNIYGFKPGTSPNGHAADADGGYSAGDTTIPVDGSGHGVSDSHWYTGYGCATTVTVDGVAGTGATPPAPNDTQPGGPC